MTKGKFEKIQERSEKEVSGGGGLSKVIKTAGMEQKQFPAARQDISLLGKQQ